MGKAKWIGDPLKCGHPACNERQAQPFDGFCPAHLERYLAPRPTSPGRRRVVAGKGRGGEKYGA